MDSSSSSAPSGGDLGNPAAALLFILLLFNFPQLPGMVEGRREALGSSPPQCANKCFNCRPCMPTLVVSSDHHSPSTRASYVESSSSSSPARVKTRAAAGTTRQVDDEDGYYLLAWKCTCRNKLFQP